MALATWWKNDPIPNLKLLPDLTVERAADDRELPQLNRVSPEELRARRSNGHIPYIAYLAGIPAAYGWVATQEASIGELGLHFTLPDRDRYLWDFATNPQWQGRGLYPRLLQAIIQHESDRAERFWIIHAPENLPSGAGMGKAGFKAVGQLAFLSVGRVGLAPLDSSGRVRIGAALLGVRLVEDDLSPCWRCMEELICTCRLSPDDCTCATPVWHSTPAD